ncbi:MAG TPA: hypothetical protein VEY11_07505 [Pyrinomonadaceae bacterium]|jgi:hypothetical protein|nr:hypothetical protein [Pyrinomonadaceae bacterium]
MADFIVRLEGIKLKQDAEDRISREIRAVVLRELAGSDFAKGDLGVRLIDKEWLGIYLRKLGREQFNVPNLRVNEFK